MLEPMPFYRRANAKVSSINHVESGPDKSRLDDDDEHFFDELSTIFGTGLFTENRASCQISNKVSSFFLSHLVITICYVKL